MGRVASTWMLAVVLWAWAPSGEAQVLVKVTVQGLFKSNHQIVVSPGTEVVWADPHFERVWFPSGTGAPRLRHDSDGYRALFTAPGTYRGTFTVVMGHGPNEIYQMTVTVRETKSWCRGPLSSGRRQDENGRLR